ncbi:hypothetical protein [Streptomyces sp. DG1A-41]
MSSATAEVAHRRGHRGGDGDPAVAGHRAGARAVESAYELRPNVVLV